MRLRIIGCTGSMSGPHSPASCYLIQADYQDPSTGQKRTWNIAFDLGPGAFGHLSRYIDVADLDYVFFSHCHADHMADVISLQVYRKWGPRPQLDPLPIAGPQNLLHRIRNIEGVEEGEYTREFVITVLRARTSIAVGPFIVTPYTARHPVDAFGFRIEGPSDLPLGKNTTEKNQSDTFSDLLTQGTSTIFYTGDTDLCDTIIDGASGVTCLLSEAGFSGKETVRGIHLTGRRAGELARKAEVGRLILTHIQPWVDPEITVSEARSEWDGSLDRAFSGALYAV